MGISDFLRRVGSGINRFASGTLNSAKNIGQNFASTITTIIKKPIEVAKTATSTIGKGIETVYHDGVALANKIVDIPKDVSNNFGKALSSPILWVGAGIAGILILKYK